jgi:predicted  nucleic acid-binding Zn-ribbon protein
MVERPRDVEEELFRHKSVLQKLERQWDEAVTKLNQIELPMQNELRACQEDVARLKRENQNLRVQLQLAKQGNPGQSNPTMRELEF